MSWRVFACLCEKLREWSGEQAGLSCGRERNRRFGLAFKKSTPTIGKYQAPVSLIKAFLYKMLVFLAMSP